MPTVDELTGSIVCSKTDLDLLAWFGKWTPEVHRADWKHRRAWPPGFREIADVSVSGYGDQQGAHEEMSVSPHRSADWHNTRELLAYGLVEGRYSCARLTTRGNAALRVARRPAPLYFESHCPEVFDKVEFEDTDDEGYEALLRWRTDADHHDVPRAFLGVTTGQRYLHGSLRDHGSFISLHVRGANSHTDLVHVAMSFEQFASLLVSNSEVPVTLDHFVGKDGMFYQEPAPPPIQAGDRMRRRLHNVEETENKRVSEIENLVRKAKMPKGAQSKILHLLEVHSTNTKLNRSFVADQLQEEASAVVESAGVLAVEMAGRSAAEMVGIAPLKMLPSGDQERQLSPRDLVYKLFQLAYSTRMKLLRGLDLIDPTVAFNDDKALIRDAIAQARATGKLDELEGAVRKAELPDPASR